MSEANPPCLFPGCGLRKPCEAHPNYVHEEGPVAKSRRLEAENDELYGQLGVTTSAMNKFNAHRKQLRAANVSAAAELRHCFKVKALGQPADWNLIERAIKILETGRGEEIEVANPVAQMFPHAQCKAEDPDKCDGKCW